MPSKQRILVPVDFSPASAAALEAACRLANAQDAELHLLHALPSPGLWHRTNSRDTVQRARQRLGLAPDPLRAVGLTIHREVVTGPIAREVVRYAQERWISLIVLGAPARAESPNGLSLELVTQILGNAPCPVHFVPLAEKMLNFTSLTDAAVALREKFGIEGAGKREDLENSFSESLAQRLQCTAAHARQVCQQLERVRLLQWESGNSDQANGEPIEKWRLVTDGPQAPTEEPALMAVDPADHQSAAIDLLQRGLAARATDIHLDPLDSEQYAVRFRIDGQMDEYCKMHVDVARPIIKQLELMGDFQVAHRRMPWEGRLRLPPLLRDMQVRIAVAPLPPGDAITMRLLSREQLLLPMSDWGLSQDAFAAVYRILHHGSGLTLVTGPTGAGKTTTVYSMLNILTEEKRNVVSIEDPIEYEVPFIRQLAVNERHGLTMSDGLAILLRMDPDVLFVGEVRDATTAQLAMQAANSGKYVFSTLHTRDVAATITALRDLEVDNRSLAANLAGIINQRLVRRLCNCARRSAVSDYEREVFSEAGLAPPGELRRPRGCAKCRHTGYFGRTGVFEALVVDGAAGEAIARGVSEAEMRQEFRRAGATTLAADALKKSLEGVTSFEEAHRILLASAAPSAPSAA